MATDNVSWVGHDDRELVGLDCKLCDMFGGVKVGVNVKVEVEIVGFI